MEAIMDAGGGAPVIGGPTLGLRVRGMDAALPYGAPAMPPGGGILPIAIEGYMAPAGGIEGMLDTDPGGECIIVRGGMFMLEALPIGSISRRSVL
mmetsp:Transcript_137291/g.382967  ORF Transcript_137291/g.382967 Transcript_137291/m.382967 type:complete len:95 (+) Transcript_137291:610-894(+)